MRKLIRLVLLLVVLVALYLSFAPTPVEPVAWTPPASPELSGPLAINQRLAGGDWRSRALVGPEAIAFDPRGGLVTGLADGRVVRLSTSSDEVALVADTGGRPLGLKFDREGRLIVCDVYRGLLAIEGGQIRVLSHEEGGVPFRFTDDLDIGSDGTIYFTDASSRFAIMNFTEDLLEHAGSGRLLAHDPKTGTTRLLLGGLSFANGVALGPDESFVTVVETGSYRVHRVWLTGERRGQHDLLIDALPGFPDNITFSKERGIFWLAIGSPRNAMVDALAPHPAIRKMVARLPKALQPAAERHAMVLGIDPSGAVVENLQHRAADSYSPVASAIERDGWLYLGSFMREGWARVRLRLRRRTPSSRRGSLGGRACLRPGRRAAVGTCSRRSDRRGAPTSFRSSC